MPFKFRFSLWRIVFLSAAVLLLWWVVASITSNEPVYQGRRLGSWLRGHPNEYRPAVLALGTNALPYLLTELQATDSRIGRWGKDLLAKLSIGPFWRTARSRHYHAGIGLQILDTNAVPGLLEMIFSQPMKLVEGDSGYSAASVLRFLGSAEAQNQVCERIAEALRSKDAEQRRNACLTLSQWPHPREDFQGLLVALSGESNATVRAAAVRAMSFTVWQDEPTLPALVSRLEDEQAAVRRLAIAALQNRGSNAVMALPALRTAYSNEVNQSNLRGDLGDGTWGAHSWSAQEIRWAIRDAIKAIDPNATLPDDSP